MSRQNLNSLFGGSLSPKVEAVLDIPDMGAQIQAGLGCNVDDVHADEVTIVALLIDDSGSIRFVPGNTEAVRDGHNMVLDSLAGTKQKSSILAHARYLNGTVLYPFVPLDQAVRMDQRNFNPTGGTPLYDQTAVMLGTVRKKTEDFKDAGMPCRSVTAIITDGNDEGSMTHGRPEDVRPLIDDMLQTEMHIILAMGITDGHTDFADIFGRMGIPKEWILTPKNTPSEIRRAFAMVSQSAVRASQARGGSFSKVAAGGFAV
jgi:hypothetical protein